MNAEMQQRLNTRVSKVIRNGSQDVFSMHVSFLFLSKQVTINMMSCLARLLCDYKCTAYKATELPMKSAPAVNV